MRYRRIADLKADARVSLLNGLQVTVLCNMLYLTVFGFLTRAEQAVIPRQPGIAFFLLDFAAWLAVVLFMGVLQAGLTSVYLKLIFGERAGITDLFSCVRHLADKAVILRLVTYGIPYLCILPAMLFLFFAAYVDGSEGYLLTGSGTQMLAGYVLLLLIPVIAAVMVLVNYGIACFVLLDYPDLSAREVLRASQRMMRGHGGRYLRLQLSFLPLYLLSALSFGMASFWVMSYHYAANAAFYRDIVTPGKPG